MTTHHCTMDLTRELAIWLLSDSHVENWLERQTDLFLFELGEKEGLWTLQEKQTRLVD